MQTTMIGTEILIHGMTKSQIHYSMNHSPWKHDYGLIQEINTMCSGGPILPQALACHMVICHGVDFGRSDIRKHHAKLLACTKKLNHKWADRLQSSLFSIAAYEIGVGVVLAATEMAKECEESHGMEPKNYTNWIYVQNFLWNIMRPKEACRWARKLIFTLLEGMKNNVDDFQDDVSPHQKLVV